MTTAYDVSGNPDPEAAALELVVRLPAMSLHSDARSRTIAGILVPLVASLAMK